MLSWIFKKKTEAAEPKPVKFDAGLQEYLKLAAPGDRWDVRVRPYSDDLPMPAPIVGTDETTVKLRFIQERFARNVQISDRARELYRTLSVGGRKSLDGMAFRSPAGGFTIQSPDHGLLIARVSTQSLQDMADRADIGWIELLHSEDNSVLCTRLRAQSGKGMGVQPK